MWDDGIRLNAYNTHLFVWNGSKFVPNQNSPLVDILSIRDGAVVRVFVTQASFEDQNGLSSDKVYIDTYENGTPSLTNYPAYYAGTEGISQYIAEEDYGTVVDFTFYDGAWYYSGGLLASSSFDTIISTITVTGGDVGGYKNGEKVVPKTTIQELFERLLIRDVDVKVGATRKLNISLAGAGTIEVGSSFSGTIVPSRSDGYFESSDKYAYPDQTFNTNNNTVNGKLDAGCAVTQTKYYDNGNEMANASIAINPITEVTHTYTAKDTYTRSSAQPKTLSGADSSVYIPAGTVTSNQVQVIGKYKCYYGTANAITAFTYDDPSEYQFLTQASIEALNSTWMDQTTTIRTITSTESRPSFVIAAPIAWEITSAMNSFDSPVPVETTWYKQNTITYTRGSVTTTYQVWVNPSTEVNEYRNITLTKQ